MKRIVFMIILLLSAALIWGSVKETADGVEFSWNAPQAGSVYVAGSFNDWSTTANPLLKGSDGVWRSVVKLPEGSHSYKFVIDGNWMYDNENPQTIDDGYGGSNSLIEVGKNSKLPAAETIAAPIASGINPKVFFDGRYYALYHLQKEKGMNRYELDKPYHDLNLGIMIKMNDNVKAYTLLNANNTREGVDMWKTHLNFKRTWLKMDAEYLQLTAFDDYGSIRFSDPLHIVGNSGYAGYDFGWGYRGILLQTDTRLFPLTQKLPFFINLQSFGADNQGNNERDVLAARLSADYAFRLFECSRTLYLGGSAYSSRINDQSYNPFTSDPVYIVDSNPAWEIDAVLRSRRENPGWQAPLLVELGYEHLAFENKREFRDFQSEGYEFIAKDEFVFQDGGKDYVFLQVKFPAALTLNAAYTHNNLVRYYEQFTDSTAVLPAPDVLSAAFNREKIALKANFELNELNLNLGMQRWTTEFPDSIASWGEYYLNLERNAGNGKYYQEANELSLAQYMLLGYDTGMLWNLKAAWNWQKLAAEYELNIAQRDISYQPELWENFLRLTYSLSSKWQIHNDTRFPIYNSSFLALKTDFNDGENVFIDSYSELSYILGENVRLSLGFGINPRVIDATSDEFSADGRRIYLESAGNLDEYLQNTYSGFGQKLQSAEKQMHDDLRFCLEAVIRF